MHDPFLITAIIVIFILAGTVKGIIGMGLPTLSLALLTILLDLPAAMTMLIMPAVLSNLWQGLSGGHFWVLVKRLWPFFLTATATVWLGTALISEHSIPFLSVLLGILLIGYGGLTLMGVQLHFTSQQEKWACPLFGLLNGFLTGMTGSSVVPGVMVLQALGLPRDLFVQAMGILFTLSTLALGLALHQNDLFSRESAILSTAAILPTFLGFWIGLKIRQHLSETRFRTVFLTAVILLGLYIVEQNIF